MDSSWRGPLKAAGRATNHVPCSFHSGLPTETNSNQVGRPLACASSSLTCAALEHLLKMVGAAGTRRSCPALELVVDPSAPHRAPGCLLQRPECGEVQDWRRERHGQRKAESAELSSSCGGSCPGHGLAHRLLGIQLMVSAVLLLFV